MYLELFKKQNFEGKPYIYYSLNDAKTYNQYDDIEEDFLYVKFETIQIKDLERLALDMLRSVTKNKTATKFKILEPDNLLLPFSEWNEKQGFVRCGMVILDSESVEVIE